MNFIERTPTETVIALLATVGIITNSFHFFSESPVVYSSVIALTVIVSYISYYHDLRQNKKHNPM